jgi:hypothetical protein
VIEEISARRDGAERRTDAARADQEDSHAHDGIHDVAEIDDLAVFTRA